VRRAARLAPLIVSGLLVATLSGCSSSSASKPVAPPGLPLATARLVDAGGGKWFAVWPSGKVWILLATSDTWQHVTAITPVAVPTDGGLAIASSTDGLAAAVGTYDRLVDSPLLTTTAPDRGWTPTELPGPVAAGRDAVAWSGPDPTAIVDNALLRRTGGSWQRVVSAAKLSSGLTLEGIRWTQSGRIGWLTGHRSDGGPVAFQTEDGGVSWTEVPAGATAARAALAPCGAGNSWLLPILGDDGSEKLLRTTDGGRSWQPGAAIQSTRPVPAWGCQNGLAWTLASVGGSAHLLTSTDAGAHWSDHGAVPAGLTDVQLVDATGGFAAGKRADRGVLYRIRLDAGSATFDRQPLPAWVDTIGPNNTMNGS